MLPNEKVIELRVGDDSNIFGKIYTINIITKLDLTGWTAKFGVQDFSKDIPSLYVEQKQIPLVFTKEETALLTPTDLAWGYLKLYNQNKEGTISKKIQMKILPPVVD